MLQADRGLDAELVGEALPELVVALQRIGGAAGGRERLRQLRGEPFVERVLVDQVQQQLSSVP